MYARSFLQSVENYAASESHLPRLINCMFSSTWNIPENVEGKSKTDEIEVLHVLTTLFLHSQCHNLTGLANFHSTFQSHSRNKLGAPDTVVCPEPTGWVMGAEHRTEKPLTLLTLLSSVSTCACSRAC